MERQVHFNTFCILVPSFVVVVVSPLYYFCPHIHTFLVWVFFSLLFDSSAILWPPMHVILVFPELLSY